MKSRPVRAARYELDSREEGYARMRRRSMAPMPRRPVPRRRRLSGSGVMEVRVAL
jgi:hypothetical protein